MLETTIFRGLWLGTNFHSFSSLNLIRVIILSEMFSDGSLRIAAVDTGVVVNPVWLLVAKVAQLALQLASLAVLCIVLVRIVIARAMSSAMSRPSALYQAPAACINYAIWWLLGVRVIKWPISLIAKKKGRWRSGGEKEARRNWE